MTSVSHSLAIGVENLRIIGADNASATGNTMANQISGNYANNFLLGLAGNDMLSGQGGNDVLFGGDGRDRLIGGTGADALIGGRDADIFDFDSVSNSSPGARDVCGAGDGAPAFESTSVAGGDLIDLSGIDANATRAGNQAFVFNGTGVGGVSVVTSGTNSLVHCNIDHDGVFEFEFLIHDGGVLVSDYNGIDFLL